MFNRIMRNDDQSTLRVLQAQDRQKLAKAGAATGQAELAQKARDEKLRRRRLARGFAQEEGLSFDDTPKREYELLELREERLRERAKAATRRRIEEAARSPLYSRIMRPTWMVL